MREIKFRLIEQGEIVGYERWNSMASKWCYDKKPDGIFDIRNEFIPHTDKEQYSSLKDKNRKEIYEGDIISERSEIINSELNYVVGFGRGFFSMKCTKTGYDKIGIWNVHNEYEIIGNVHRNPEL